MTLNSKQAWKFKMKLSELFLTQEDFADKRQEKLQSLKQAIEAGKKPEIHSATSTIKGWAWGDLQELGFAEREQKSAGRTEMDERWVYNGPEPITLLTPYSNIKSDGSRESGVRKQIMQAGDATDWVTVDYS